MIPARPLYQGDCGSVWDHEPSKERVGDWGRPATVWSLLCVAGRVPRGRTESGGIVLAANAGPRLPSGGVTLKRRCTYRPSVTYLIVNKLLSLSLSLSLSQHPPLPKTFIPITPTTFNLSFFIHPPVDYYSRIHFFNFFLLVHNQNPLTST